MFRPIGALASEIIGRMEIDRQGGAMCMTQHPAEPRGVQAPSAGLELGKMGRAVKPGPEFCPGRENVTGDFGGAYNVAIPAEPRRDDTNRTHMRPVLRLVVSRGMESVKRRTTGSPARALSRPMLIVVASPPLGHSSVSPVKGTSGDLREVSSRMSP